MAAPVECPVSYYCPDANATSPTECPAGYNCGFPGLSAPMPCGEGFFCSNSSTGPAACPLSYYCPGATATSPTECPVGYYCGETGLSAPTECGEGHYCSDASMTAPTECPPSYYCPDATATSPTECPVGYYCGEVGLSAPTECGEGHYCSDTSMTAPTSCPEGYFCPSNTTTSPVECGIGYYCETGALAPQECLISHYCPDATAASPTQCPAGYFCDQTGLAAPTECGVGYYCSSTSMAAPLECPTSFYCPDANATSPTECPPGYFCGETGLASPKECGEGYYCSSTSMAAPMECPTSFYCPDANATSPTECPAGYFCGVTNLTSPTECGEGYYCSNTSMAAPTPCPVSYYCPDTAATSPLGCPSGFYCDKTGLAAPIECGEGYFCNEILMAAPTECPISYYCPNATGTSPKECPAGYYCDVKGLANATECGRGYYCSNTSMTEPKECPISYYCPNAVSMHPMDCPQGYYCNSNSMADPLPCPVGAFCPDTNVVEPTICDSGYTCFKEGSSHQLLCPAGSYCKNSSSWPITCEIGTYCPAGSMEYILCDGYAFETCPYTNMTAPMNCSTIQIGGPQCYSLGDSLEYCEAVDLDDYLQYTCVCLGLWLEPYCDDRQNITNSLLVGFISLMLTLILMIPCFCFDAVSVCALYTDHAFNRTVKKQFDEKLKDLQKKNRSKEQNGCFLRLKCVEKMKSKLEVPICRNANSFIWRKLKKLKKCLYFVIMLVVFCFVDLFRTLANVYLIVRTLQTNLSLELTLEEKIDEVVEAFTEFLEIFGPFGWIASLYSFFVQVCQGFDFLGVALEEVDVTCSGSQAPLKLFTNSIVVIVITILFESKVHHFINTTINCIVKEKEKRLKIKGYPWFMRTAMGSSINFVIFLFVFTIQLMAATMTFGDFFPFHEWEPLCGIADMVLAISSSVIAWLMCLGCFHILLRTFIWGLPKEQMESKLVTGTYSLYEPYQDLLKNICCYSPYTHFKRDKDFYDDKNFDIKKKRSNQDLCGYLDALVLILVDIVAYRKVETLLDYLKIIMWKLKMILQMIIGYWDKEMKDAFYIEKMIEESQGAYPGLNEFEKEYKNLSNAANSHILVLQFVPSLVVGAKLTEATNNPPLFIEGIMGDKYGEYFTRFIRWILRVLQFGFMMMIAIAPAPVYFVGYCLVGLPLMIYSSLKKVDADTSNDEKVAPLPASQKNESNEGQISERSDKGNKSQPATYGLPSLIIKPSLQKARADTYNDKNKVHALSDIKAFQSNESNDGQISELSDKCNKFQPATLVECNKGSK